MAKSFPNTGTTVIDAVGDLPASPSEGMMVFQKDTNELKIYDGSVWVSMLDTDNKPMDAWATAPSVTILQPGAITHTVNYSKYIKLGRIVHWNFGFNVTGAGTASNYLYMSLPFAASDQTSVIGGGWIFDSSTATRYAYVAEMNTGQANIIFVGDWSAGNGWGNNPSLGIASGDQIRGSFTYETTS